MFLSKQDTEENIKQWVDKLTSRIVMHEHEDGVDNIIWDYICCGQLIDHTKTAIEN